MIENAECGYKYRNINVIKTARILLYIFYANENFISTNELLFTTETKCISIKQKCNASYPDTFIRCNRWTITK